MGLALMQERQDERQPAETGQRYFQIMKLLD